MSGLLILLRNRRFLHCFGEVSWGGPTAWSDLGDIEKIVGRMCICWQDLGRIEWIRLRDKEGRRRNFGWPGITSRLTTLDSISTIINTVYKYDVFS